MYFNMDSLEHLELMFLSLKHIKTGHSFSLSRTFSFSNKMPNRHPRKVNFLS